jgi:hypothetical protein
VAGNFDRAVSWMHTYTAEADPAQDVCRNCHEDESDEISVEEEEYLEHAMLNRTSRVAMDNVERVVNNGLVFGEIEDPLNPDPEQAAQRVELCSNCHRNGRLREANNCNQVWRRHLIEGRVSEVVWEDISAPLGGCGW